MHIILLILFFVPIFAQDGVAPPPTNPANAAIENANNQLYTTSQQIPDTTSTVDLMTKLRNTVWITSDLKRNEDLYIFFTQSKQGVALTKRGGEVPLPTQLYPIKLYSKTGVNSGIFIIPTEQKILYYTFHLITPFFLAVSPGFDSPDGLSSYTLESFFQNGYILQLVY